ncbi:MAG: hypothetical protein QM831_10005 [Kofleriaceae bacterium]
MTVLILIGVLVKLVFATAATHRTRWFWLPGVAAIGMGIGESFVTHVPEVVAEGSVVLGCCALVLALLSRA